MKLNRHIFALLIWMIVSVAYSQTNANTQVQLAEQKVKIENLEREQKELKEEIAKNNTNLEAKLDDKFYVKTENLSSEKEHVAWWLNILGIVIAFFGIAIPILGIFYGRSITKEVKTQIKEAENFINNARKDAVDLIKETKEKVKEIELQAKEYSSKIKELYKEINPEPPLAVPTKPDANEEYNIDIISSKYVNQISLY